MSKTISGVLPPLTLARLRAIQERIALLEAQRTDLLSVFLEAQGHDPNGLELTGLDLASGVFTAAPVARSPNGTAEVPA